MYFHRGLIPFYLLVINLGLKDSRLALILPRAVNTFNLIVMRTAFASVSPSLSESAKMDGAHDRSGGSLLFSGWFPVSPNHP
ncbi:MAG: hypothetical protein HN368_22820 [Spirochaetales bacterium]|nr:hypothetical protein [Spirochaetales bacterium]